MSQTRLQGAAQSCHAPICVGAPVTRWCSWTSLPDLPLAMAYQQACLSIYLFITVTINPTKLTINRFEWKSNLLKKIVQSFSFLILLSSGLTWRLNVNGSQIENSSKIQGVRLNSSRMENGFLYIQIRHMQKQEHFLKPQDVDFFVQPGNVQKS